MHSPSFLGVESWVEGCYGGEESGRAYGGGGGGARGGLTQDEIIWEGSRFVGSREKLPLKWIFGPTIGNMKLFDQIAKLNRVGQNCVPFIKAHYCYLTDNTIYPKNMNMINLSLVRCNDETMMV